MLNQDVFMAHGNRQWRDGNCITLTFCVTESCNLNCSYCYMTGKNSSRVMDYETAKRAVDFALSDPYVCREDAVVWDFIGGEPLLEIEMIDKLCDYIVLRMYATGHKWFDRYRFAFSTNGTLFHLPKVQQFINKHKGHVWFTFSLDGNKEKHDLARKKKDGSGSYDEVIRNVPLWLRHFPDASTKSTFSHDDLPYLKDSIVHIWEQGVKMAMANVVYEDVWEDGDDDIFEQQLRLLADHIIDNRLWDSCATTFFSAMVGQPVGPQNLMRTRCGAGIKSLAFDCEGNIYPCIRFLEMCLSKNKKVILGNLEKGLNSDYLRAFIAADWKSQSPDKCNSCPFGTDCGWCIGYNFEDSPRDTIYDRTTYVCKMHQANVRANRYFWKRYSAATGETSPYTLVRSSLPGIKELQYLYFITSDGITPHCGYRSNPASGLKMPQEVVDQGLAFCLDNSLVPSFLGTCAHDLDAEKQQFFTFADSRSDCPPKAIRIFKQVPDHPDPGNGIGILLINRDNLTQMCAQLAKLFEGLVRVNLFIQDLSEWRQAELTEYALQLEQAAQLLSEAQKQGKPRALNLLSDPVTFDRNISCGAGVNSLALAPNGKFYICPAFYFDDPANDVGTLQTGLRFPAKRLCQRESSPYCGSCELHTCTRCLFLNKKLTREMHIPSAVQCAVARLNEKWARQLGAPAEAAQSTTPADPVLEQILRKEAGLVL